MGEPIGRRTFASGALGAGVALASPAVRAQAWPKQTVKIICGYPPGGSTDAFARAYGDYAAQKLGQPFDLFGIDDAAQDWRALERFMREMGRN